MTVLRHNFDGGPDGTTLTVANSDDVPGNDGFNVISPVGSGATLQYRDAATFNRATAEYVLHTATAGTTSAAAFLWSTAMGTQTEIWFRQYIRPAELPVTSGHSTDAAIFECDNGAVYCGFLYVGRTDGKLYAMNGPSTANINTTNALPLNEWSRIEARFKFSTTVGEVEVDLYLEPDSDTPTESISASGWNMGAANANSFAFGQPLQHSNKPDYYFSGIELNNTGFPGPAPFRPGKGVPGILSNPVAIHTATF